MSETQVVEEVVPEEKTVTLEEVVWGLVNYIRGKESSEGPFNTAHGPLLILDPEVLDEYLSQIEEILGPPQEPVVQPLEPEKVQGQAVMEGQAQTGWGQ